MRRSAAVSTGGWKSFLSGDSSNNNKSGSVCDRQGKAIVVWNTPSCKKEIDRLELEEMNRRVENQPTLFQKQAQVHFQSYNHISKITPR